MQHISVSTVAAVAEGSGYRLGARSKYYVRGSIHIYIYIYIYVYVRVCVYACMMSVYKKTKTQIYASVYTQTDTY